MTSSTPHVIASSAKNRRGRAVMKPAAIASALAAALNAGIARRRTSLTTASVVVSSTQTCARARQRTTAATPAQSA